MVESCGAFERKKIEFTSSVNHKAILLKENKPDPNHVLKHLFEEC
jgi:hypothetical protein